MKSRKRLSCEVSIDHADPSGAVQCNEVLEDAAVTSGECR
jgi:hypothetical protein